MEEIIDIISPDFRRGHFKRRFLRVVVPIAFVVLMMAAILGIALYSYTNNRRDALALSEDALRSLDRRIATEVRSFLAPASDLVKIVDSVLAAASSGADRGALADPLATQMLKNIPQLAIFSLADTGGNYMMLKKMPDGSIHTKIIERGEAGITVTWIHRDTEGREIGREYPADDTYDPRMRPWYIGAVGTPGVFWTDVYIFFTDQKPGITAAKAFRDEKGEVAGVVGLDIGLASLSTFLGSLQIGRSGRAMIIDENGRLVAYPEMGRMLKPKHGQLTALRLDEMGDPVLERAYSRFLVERDGWRELTVQGHTYINTVSSLQSAVGKKWSVLIVVPSEDFVGFVSRNNRKALLMSVGVLILASLLAGLLIWQGLRADRNARLLLARRQEIEAQSRAFSDLAGKPAVFNPADIEALAYVTRITAEAIGVRRAGVWQFQPDGRELTCSDSYDRESGGHTSGTVLLQEDLPQLFEALRAEDPIQTGSAVDDPRTAELHRLYLHPLGCNALLSIPISNEGQVRGVLWFEQESASRGWPPEDIAFGRAVAGLLALRLSADGMLAACPPPDAPATGRGAAELSVSTGINRRRNRAGINDAANPTIAATRDMRQATIVDMRAQVFRKAMKQQDSATAVIGADIYDQLTVLVLQFIDPIALAKRLGRDDPTTTVDRLIRQLEALASEIGVGYMKFMGDRLVCAAGFREDTENPARTIAELALNIQDICLRIDADLTHRLDFRIGIDIGAVIGSMVGGEFKSYNLWGEAVRMAELMAESGTTGEIHVSEGIYRRLQTEYLFKARGNYYLPDVGELATYILTGRI
ncbi:MAG: adenylate/guanylate cyclase domain-containing protein [Desulfobacterales bacterium]